MSFKGPCFHIAGVTCDNCRQDLPVHPKYISVGVSLFDEVVRLRTRLAFAESMLERAKRLLEYMADGHCNDGDASNWLADLERGGE